MKALFHRLFFLSSFDGKLGVDAPGDSGRACKLDRSHHISAGPGETRSFSLAGLYWERCGQGCKVLILWELLASVWYYLPALAVS